LRELYSQVMIIIYLAEQKLLEKEEIRAPFKALFLSLTFFLLSKKLERFPASFKVHFRAFQTPDPFLKNKPH